MYRQRQPLLNSEQEAIVTSAIACGITVHRELGPGFKETIYERAFCLELESRGIKFECEKPVEVRYKQWRIPGQRIDLIVDGVVLVEIKTVTKIEETARIASDFVSEDDRAAGWPFDELQFGPFQARPEADRPLRFNDLPAIVTIVIIVLHS